MKKVLLLFVIALSTVVQSNAQCKDVAIVVAASFDTLVLTQTNAKSLLPHLPLTYQWEARLLDGTMIDTSTNDRFFADLGTLSLDTFVICLEVTDTLGSVCGMCDTFTFRNDLEHWRPISTNTGKTLSINPVELGDQFPEIDRIVDILGRQYESVDQVPSGVIYIENRQRKIKVAY